MIFNEAHEISRLFGSTLPVFRRKNIERNVFDAERAHGSDNFFRLFGARIVPGAAVFMLPFGPPAVPVHDERDVAGQAARIE